MALVWLKIKDQDRGGVDDDIAAAPSEQREDDIKFSFLAVHHNYSRAPPKRYQECADIKEVQHPIAFEISL